MIKIYCSNCGQLINEKSNYCRFCGAPQNGKQASVFRAQLPQLEISQTFASNQPNNTFQNSDFSLNTSLYLSKMAIVYFFLQYARFSIIILVLLLAGSVFRLYLFVPMIIIYLAFLVLLAYLKYKFYRYSLADSFLLIEWGIITKKQVSIPYVKIQNINIKRNALDIILGLAQINIETAGGEEVVKDGNSSYFSEGELPAINFSISKKLHDTLLEMTKQAQNKTR